MPFLGKLPRSHVVEERIENLNEWRVLVAAYEEQIGRLPEGLYEACQCAQQLQHSIPMPMPIVDPHQWAEGAEQWRLAMGSKERFQELVEYDLLTDDHAWFVRELKACVLYPEGTFMVAQDGVVYELRRKEKLEQELARRKSSGGRSPLRESQ